MLRGPDWMSTLGMPCSSARATIRASPTSTPISPHWMRDFRRSTYCGESSRSLRSSASTLTNPRVRAMSEAWPMMLAKPTTAMESETARARLMAWSTSKAPTRISTTGMSESMLRRVTARPPRLTTTSVPLLRRFQAMSDRLSSRLQMTWARRPCLPRSARTCSARSGLGRTKARWAWKPLASRRSMIPPWYAASSVAHATQCCNPVMSLLCPWSVKTFNILILFIKTAWNASC